MSTGNDVDSRDLHLPDEVEVLTAERAALGQRLAPRKVIQTYDADEWEIFIEEWASGLASSYVRVQRFGGAGDKGVDVAGFKTSRGFEGEWDCFQGKHYGRSLTPSDAWPEMLKIFLLPIQNPGYLLPSDYRFIAPRGSATGLAHLISSPTKLKSKFIEKLKSGEWKRFTELKEEVRNSVLQLAEDTDFSLFGSIEVRKLIDEHSKTPYHVARFGGGLPPRPAPSVPPENIIDGELVYIHKLVDVYKERHTGIDSIERVMSHDWASKHFARQRESFFRAESLRDFARDSVPPNTFESLQDDIYDAVIETVEENHTDGLERLRHTLQQAVNAHLSANALIQSSGPADRRGICHQLANDDRLSWIGC